MRSRRSTNILLLGAIVLFLTAGVFLVRKLFLGARL